MGSRACRNNVSLQSMPLKLILLTQRRHADSRNHRIYKSTHVNELPFVSPAWKSLWQVHSQLIGDADTWTVRRKDGSPINYRELYKSDHIFFCLTALGERPESAGYVDATNLGHISPHALRLEGADSFDYPNKALVYSLGSFNIVLVEEFFKSRN